MEGYFLFIAACLTIGILSRMAMGQTAAEATRNGFNAAAGPLKVAGKVAGVGWKVYRRS